MARYALSGALSILSVASSQAAIIKYGTLTDFEAATSGNSTITFDSSFDPTLGAVYEGGSFTIGGVTFIVSVVLRPRP